jgi:hypothetical protein
VIEDRQALNAATEGFLATFPGTDWRTINDKHPHPPRRRAPRRALPQRQKAKRRPARLPRRSTIQGRKYWLAGWVKEAKSGAKYLSISLRPKEEETCQAPSPARRSGARPDSVTASPEFYCRCSPGSLLCPALTAARSDRRGLPRPAKRVERTPSAWPT